MNKSVGEDLGAMLGEVIQVRSDSAGAATDRCIHIRVRVDINKPLVRWTSTSIEGTPCRIMFLYEKLAGFCYFCGNSTTLIRLQAYPAG